MVILDYLEYSDLESDVEDVLDLSQVTMPIKVGRIKAIIPSRLRRALSPIKTASREEAGFERPSNLPSLSPHKRISNNLKRIITEKRRRSRLVSIIPKKSAKIWAENYSAELDRFIRLTSGEYDSEFWDPRVRMDLQRASHVLVSGLVQESFVFSEHETMETRVDLVEIFLKFLKASIKEVISDAFSYLSEEGQTLLAQKAVSQGVVTLCQDFINEPYFRLLKMTCEDYGLTPLSNKESPMKSDILGSDGQIWTTDVSVNISSEEMILDVKRTFSTVWVTDGDIIPAEYILGFKRRYSVDLLGGPPKIYPPVWMGHGYGKTREVCCKPVRVKATEMIDSREEMEIPKYQRITKDNLIPQRRIP